MGTWHCVAKVGQLREGEGTSVEAKGVGIALFNVGGRIYALDNTCPHAGGPLGEGLLDGYIVKCPWHGWRYDVRTGERPENPVFTVPCYEVQVDRDQINVLLPDSPGSL